MKNMNDLPQTRTAKLRYNGMEWLRKIAELPQSRTARGLAGVRAVETGQLARARAAPQTKEAHIRTGERAVRSGQIFAISRLPQSIEAHRRSGNRNAENGNLEKARLALLAKRPTWPEVRFYGLVLGEPTTAMGFSAQRSDGHGIYDGAWRTQRIIAELDGGAHHVFKDRHADDMKKDIKRLLDGNTVLRETDESVLFLKALAILREG